MAKVKNLHLYGTPERLSQLKEEYDWAGRNVTRYDRKDGHLIVFALPPAKKKKKKVREEKPEQAEGSQEKRPQRRKGNGHERIKRFEA